MMIGILPKSLNVDGIDYPINPDYRVALLIFQAYSDSELNDIEKSLVCIKCLYKKVPKDLQQALEKALWFLDGGNIPKSKQAPIRIMDWEQDESIIFPAINKVAGKEVRSLDYMHWWTFLGMFGEIGDGLYSQVMNIRSKKAKHKKLDQREKQFYREHKELIDLSYKPTSQEEQEDLDFINSII